MYFLLAALLIFRPASAAEDLSDFSTKPEAAAAYALRHARILHWSEVYAGPEPIIYVGDFHNVKACSEAMAASLAQAKRAGITHIAPEILSQAEQTLLNYFCARGSCLQRIRKELHEQIPDSYHPDSHFAVIERAHDAGLTFLGFEAGDEETSDLTRAAQLSILDHPVFRGRRSAEWTGQDLSAFNTGVTLKRAQERDERIVAGMAYLLKDEPGARIVAWFGAYHGQASHEPRQLERLGIRSRSYVLWTSDMETGWLGPIESTLAAMGRAISGAGLAGPPRLVPLPKKEAGFDGLIWLPSAARETRP